MTSLLLSGPLTVVSVWPWPIEIQPWCLQYTISLIYFVLFITLSSVSCPNFWSHLLAISFGAKSFKVNIFLQHPPPLPLMKAAAEPENSSLSSSWSGLPTVPHLHRLGSCHLLAPGKLSYFWLMGDTNQFIGARNKVLPQTDSVWHSSTPAICIMVILWNIYRGHLFQKGCSVIKRVV